ncbi:hypothetical protein B0I35DRAFT_463407 [Stachybotrys elegans]|uniref:FAD-binding PCMH-type domain-containing protein n=1 Tax=Stachybotrys elegans TaxID=80388 RepID=A0A8K0SP07_9HYPO|nr:hypothetical protein B0I35DRAFT_463407 [Stachybotrys elegans]
MQAVPFSHLPVWRSPFYFISRLVLTMKFAGSLVTLLALGTCSEALPAPAALPAQSTCPAKAIQALRGVFRANQVVQEGAAAYEDINESYLSNLNNDLTPAAVVLPDSSADVAKFVRTLRPYALSGQAYFAIKGAGQQPLPACNNIEEGITLDLRNLTGIQVDQAKGVVSVGAGVRWATVYEVLEPLGLAVTGGRSGPGGIGGLSLSGGLSFFSSREGFITDNIVEFEVVLSSGQIVRANDKENSDLYRALRGGGNNFGIVTKFTLRTFEQGPFYGGSVYYFPPSFPSQIDALVNELTKPDPTPESHLMLSIGYSAAFAQLGGTLALNQVYYTREEENPEVLRPFTEVQPQLDFLNSMRNLTLVSATSEQTSQNTDAQRVAYMNIHVKADAATLKYAADAYLAGIQPIQDAANITLSFTLQPYAVSLLEKTSFKGGNSLGLSPADGPIVSVLFLTWWQEESDDERIISTLRGVLESIDTEAKARKTSLPFVYMNYAHTFQDPINSYGKSNKAKLQLASLKYDKLRLFQNDVPGGFKLF